jgi:uncharacterized protein YdeI (YjbR/CyaY-like superfamily)
MGRAPPERLRIHPESRVTWRAWLADHAADTQGVWLVSWRKHTGRPAMTYSEAVEEALCFGWVDSKPAKLDEDRTMLYFSPRRRGSAWSRSNKQRIQLLMADGRMTRAGLTVVEQAKADGTWSLLDEVEDLVVPADLAAALDALPSARAQWEAFPRSARRGILEWIAQAKRPETRSRRLAETAELAQQGERANQWRDRTGGPPRPH